MRLSGLSSCGLLLLASASSLFLPRLASAEDDPDTVEARKLFIEATELAEAERFSEAEELFRKALALRDSPNIHYNLAIVLERQGLLGAALDELDGVVASDETDRRLMRDAKKLRRSVGARAGKIRVEVVGPRDDVSLSVDQRVLTFEDIERPVRVGPGEHVVMATRRGLLVARQEVSVEAQGEVSVTLELSVPDPATAAGMAMDDERPPGDVQEADDAGKEGVHKKWWFWTTVGGAVVLAVVVGVVAAGGGGKSPVEGNLDPAVLRVEVAR